MSGSRGGGYWIHPGEEPEGAVVGPSADRGTGRAEPPAGAGEPRTRLAMQPPPGGGRRSGRSVVLWMVASMAVLVVLAVLAALALTGRVVLPGISAKLFPIHYSAEISQAAAKYDQDPYLIAAMVRTESDFDPLATSGSGAVGLMQLMPATAEWVAEQSGAWPEGESPVLTDPVDSLELGVWYIDYLGGLYGKGTLAALAAYNAGLGNVDDWIAEAGDAFDVSDIPFQETRDYVERVERYKSLYERIHPDAFDSSGQ